MDSHHKSVSLTHGNRREKPESNGENVPVGGINDWFTGISFVLALFASVVAIVYLATPRTTATTSDLVSGGDTYTSSVSFTGLSNSTATWFETTLFVRADQEDCRPLISDIITWDGGYLFVMFRPNEANFTGDKTGLPTGILKHSKSYGTEESQLDSQSYTHPDKMILVWENNIPGEPCVYLGGTSPDAEGEYHFRGFFEAEDVTA